MYVEQVVKEEICYQLMQEVQLQYGRVVVTPATTAVVSF